MEKVEGLKYRDVELVRPGKFLSGLLCRELVILLKNGQTIIAVLNGYDQYLNLVLSDFKLIGGNLHLKPKKDQTIMVKGDSIFGIYGR